MASWEAVNLNPYSLSRFLDGLDDVQRLGEHERGCPVEQALYGFYDMDNLL